MNKKDGISIIICCYNSIERLQVTLEHLFLQKFGKTPIDWEIIVVDNASTDGTAEFAYAVYNKFDVDVLFKVVKEEKPGLSHARNKGFSASQFEFVLMVDDDNWLCQEYVEKVYHVLNEHQEAAMVGGLGIPELKGKEPTWFNNLASTFATGAQSSKADETLSTAIELYGAGCAVRMSALNKLKQAGFVSLLSDRTGQALSSGGDTELCYAFRLAGYKLLYNSSISFKHELPTSRVNWRYMRKLFFGFGIGKARIDIYTAALGNKPLPADGKLPFWLNRIVYLTKYLFKDVSLLILGSFFKLEGNERLLHALAKLGQLKGIFQIRNQYVNMFYSVYKLKDRLNSNEKG